MTLRQYLQKSDKPIQHPGSRGGHYYINSEGHVVYGEPTGDHKKLHALDVLRRAVKIRLMSDSQDWSFLTACHKDRTPAENRKLNAQLFHDLHAHGARIISCRGYFTYPDDRGGMGVTEEPAFLGLGLGSRAAIHLGHKYGQVSILSNEGFFDCDKPSVTRITSKRVIDGEIPKDQDQSVIYVPPTSITFLVNGDWDNPEIVPAHLGYYDHLQSDVAKSFGGGDNQTGGYPAPIPPTSNMVLLAAEVNLESAL